MRVLKRKGCQITLVILLVLIGIGVFVSYRWVDFPFAAAKIGHEWERAQKNGLPLTADAFKPNPPIAKEENAAPELLVIAPLIKEQVDALKQKDAVARAKKPDLPEATYLDIEAKVIEPFRDDILKAIQKPKYYVERDYDKSVDLLFPEFANYKTMAKGFAGCAINKARSGDASGSIEDLNAGYRLSQLIAQDQTLIAMLVAIAIDAIETRSIERIAEGWQNDPERLKSLRTKVLGQYKPQFDFRHAMKSEMYMGLSLMRNLHRYGGVWNVSKMASGDGEGYVQPDPKAPFVRTGYPKGIIARAFAAKSLAYWNDMVESPEWKSGEVREMGKKMDLLAKDKSFEKTHKLSDLMNSILLPVFSQAGMSIIRADVARSTVNSLLLVLEFRAKNHRFPESLKEAGAEAQDPFANGKSLMYTTDGKSCAIWSIGPDGKDDGGDPKSNHDIVAMFPARPVK